MAAPVHNQPPQPAIPPQPANAVGGPVPAGVGGAPTQLQAQGQPPAKEKGYVERAVHAIRDLIVWLFGMICCCFKKKDATPPPVTPQNPAPAQDPQPAQPQPGQQQPPPQLVQQQQPQLPQQAPPPPDLRAKHQALLNRVDRLERWQLVRSFEECLSKRERQIIYERIGRDPQTTPGRFFQSYAWVGENHARANPELLRPYLRQKLEEPAN